MRFDELNLLTPILRAIDEQGYETATPIQAQAIPFVLEGRDVLGCAQTGTGKTAAFALPIIHRLFADGGSKPQPHEQPHEQAREQASDAGGDQPQGKRGRGKHGKSGAGKHKAGKPRRKPRCLVLAPTRELATQIAEGFQAYGARLPMRGVCVFGGVSQRPQVAKLERGVDVIIATPGRLMDLMQQGHVDLSAIDTLVLDEADRMLDMGFIHDIRRIVSHLSDDRQTLLFSATMPPAIRELTHALLRNPAKVTIAPEQPTTDRVEQRVHFVERAKKPDLLAELIETENMYRVIVFTRTKHGADRLVKQLRQRGVEGEAIHGDKSQGARQRALENFKRNKIPVLVATDIASRGIDVDSVSHVVNYDLTHEPETYVHRIGRTGRAEKTGEAVSFCDASEVENLRAIERLLGREIPVVGHRPGFAMSKQEKATRSTHPMQLRPHAAKKKRRKSGVHPASMTNAGGATQQKRKPRPKKKAKKQGAGGKPGKGQSQGQGQGQGQAQGQGGKKRGRRRGAAAPANGN